MIKKLKTFSPILLLSLAAPSCKQEQANRETTLASPALVAETGIAYPANYRETFTNYLSLDRIQNDDQVIRLFANDIAMQGPGDDGTLPLGSILIGEVYKAKKDADGEVVTSGLGRRIKDKFALVAVMEKREEFAGRYSGDLDNGQWDYAAFKPDGTIAEKDLNTCRACHAPMKESDFIFSMEHLPTQTK